MRERLREHARNAFDMMIRYFEVIMDGFPDDKMEERIGNASSPIELLQHVGGTAGWWMKRTGQPFAFSSKLSSRQEFFKIVRMQKEAFEELLADDRNLYWKSQTSDKPELSVPWIMIRAANHGLHHGAMLIHYRHIYELPPLNFPEGLDWGKVVDVGGDIHYSSLT